MFVAGLILSFALIAFGVGATLRQRRTWLRLREERFLPTDERAYLRGQVRRRLATAVAVAAIGAMIGGSYLSGHEERATRIAERSREGPAAEPPTDDDKEFVKRYGYFWLTILVLVCLAVTCAIFDFWATRCYWMAQYRIIRSEHEAKLRRDLAVHRQAKDNDRMSGLGNAKPDDDTDENPPTGRT